MEKINKYEIIPAIAVNMEHKIILSQRQKELLLNERQNIIKESAMSIQNNFMKIGKALGEIRKFKLYKADPIHNTWSAFIKNRLAYKLHQSTITDYISIVNMQNQYNDFMTEQGIVNIGYKKAKLIKSKLTLINKEKDNNTKNKLRQTIKEFYNQNFKELKNIPFSTYSKALDERLNKIKTFEKHTKKNIQEENNNYTLKLDKQRKRITCTINNKDDYKNLETLFNTISNAISSEITENEK